MSCSHHSSAGRTAEIIYIYIFKKTLSMQPPILPGCEVIGISSTVGAEHDGLSSLASARPLAADTLLHGWGWSPAYGGVPGASSDRPRADGEGGRELMVSRKHRWLGGVLRGCPQDRWSVQAKGTRSGSAHSSSHGVSPPAGKVFPGGPCWGRVSGGVCSLRACPETTLGPRSRAPGLGLPCPPIALYVWAGGSAEPGIMPFRVIPGKAECLPSFILGPGARTCLLNLQLAQFPPRFSGGRFLSGILAWGLHVVGERSSAVCSPLYLNTSRGPQSHLGPLPLSTWAQEKQVTHFLPQVMQPGSEVQPGSGLPGVESCQHSPPETAPQGPSRQARCLGSKWSRNDAKKLGSFPRSPRLELRRKSHRLLECSNIAMRWVRLPSCQEN